MTRPSVDHDDAVGQRVGLVEVLGGEQDGDAVGDEPADHAPHALPAGGVEPGGRLVEKQHRRAHHQAGGQVEAPAHAARVALDHAVGGVGELEQLEQLGRPAPRLGAPQPAELADHHQVLAPREASSSVASWPVTPILRRTAAASATTSWPATHARPLSGVLSVVRMRRPVVLPAPLGPEHAEDRAGGDLQIHLVERLRLAVALRQRLGLDHQGLTHAHTYRSVSRNVD